MAKQLENQTSLVFSYLTLRKVIGLLGTLLPLVVALGAWIVFQTGLQDSISSYYHTDMRDVFVGTLFAIGFFLLSYRGYERADRIAGNLACVFAVGAALFPTNPDGVAEGARFIGYIHFAFAALLFLTLIYFSLFLFTKTDASQPPTKQKLKRNMIYRVSGYAMLASIILIVVYFRLPGEVMESLDRFNPVFWLETITVVAFGISWLTKGEAILADED